MAVPKDKETRRLQAAKMSLMSHPKFSLYSGVLMMGDTYISDDIPTACTDGINDYYGRKFVAGMTNQELAFLVMHETLHKAYRHLFVWKALAKENAMLANMAMDYVINYELVHSDPNKETISMPAGGLYDSQYANMTTKQVYDMLKKNGKPSGGGGFDEHDWKAADKLTPEEQAVIQKELESALRQGKLAQEKLVGKNAGGMSRELEDLLNPQIDWRDALREFVSSICADKTTSSWRRLNKRYLSMDISMPTLTGETVGNIVCGVDTSGSIGGDDLNKFLSEVVGICNMVNPEVLHIMYWDTAVAGHEQYGSGSYDAVFTQTKPKGGGGTDPSCVSAYLHEHNIKPDVGIMLTDGEVPSWGKDWPAPILWVVCNPRKPMADCGKTVFLS